ncbi:energy transducer TonB [Swaminathania salitolerans]|uniref:TonB C-terminal domain-containing protein n=1 Tax=Swaminathania salitolerans TaxID=182838 RepID=A0A511BNG6_9PROT|nr:energy transducer TonB [Swaminathania salitolerans]GBQ14762.1 hypothetical protein AA21291_1948 [Swaminathania salitolerans LMG 21291]GEL01879.1 hypothetical protein SSA02_10420 [Swaminathania salitolerans]
MNAFFAKRGYVVLGCVLISACSPSPQVSAAGAGFTKSERVSGPNPYYPFEALKNGESAKVMLKVDVDRSGHPHNCRVDHSSNVHFNASALQFCQKSEFKAATMNGAAVEDVGRDFPVNYSSD